MIYRYLLFLFALPATPLGLAYWLFHRVLDLRYTAQGQASRKEYDQLVAKREVAPGTEQADLVKAIHEYQFQDAARANAKASWAWGLLASWVRLLHVQTKSRTEFAIGMLRGVGNGVAFVLVLGLLLTRGQMHSAVDLLYDGRDEAASEVNTAATQSFPSWFQATARKAIGAAESEQVPEVPATEAADDDSSPSDTDVAVNKQ
jgi:hypothetical protein